jgi:hypothetical protein
MTIGDRATSLDCDIVGLFRPEMEGTRTLPR